MRSACSPLEAPLFGFPAESTSKTTSPWRKNPNAQSFRSCRYKNKILQSQSIAEYKAEDSGPHLLFGAPVWVHFEVHLLHEPLDHAHRVRPLRLGVDALVHDDGRNVPGQTAEVRLPFFVRHLELAVVQDLWVDMTGLRDWVLHFSSDHHDC